IIQLLFFWLVSSLPVSAQFSGGAEALNESRVIHRAWHLTNLRGSNYIVKVSGSSIVATDNDINDASTFIIEPGIDDANWLTADSRWFHIRNLSTGQYLTVAHSGGLPRAVSLTEYNAQSHAQQFRLIATGVASQYKLRSRISAGSGTDLVLETSSSGLLQADSPKLDPSSEQKFTFNLAMPGSGRRYILCSPGGRFMSDNGIKAEGTQVIQNKDVDEAAIWMLEHVENSFYRIRNTLTQQFLTAPSESSAGDIPVMTASAQGNRSQWELDQTDAFFRLKSRAFPNLFISATDQASGHPVRLRTSADSFRRWLVSAVEGELETVPGDYARIESGVLPSGCLFSYGSEFKKALCERVGLNPAQSELYFNFIREAIAAKEGESRVDELLQKFDLNNFGHRVDLALMVRYYITEVLPFVPFSQWSPAAQAAMGTFQSKITQIRSDYADRLFNAWNAYVQENGSNLTMADIYFFWIDGDGFQWPVYYDVSETEAYLIADYVSGAATFGERNNGIVGATAIGGTVATLAVVYAKAPFLILWLAYHTGAPLTATGLAGGTSVGAYAVMAGGPVIAVTVFAASFIAMQATEVSQFQQFTNTINEELAWAQQYVDLAAGLSGNNLLTRIKLLNDLDLVLGAPVQGGFVHNTNDNFYQPAFTLSCVPSVTLDMNSTGDATLTASQVVSGIIQLCGSEITYNLSQNQFDCNDIPSVQVTLMAQNDKGAQSCNVTVNLRDNTPPTVTCPAAQTLTLGANCTAVLPDYRYLATHLTDNCDIDMATQSPPAGTVISGAGDMTITFTVTDVSGNSAQCSFTLTKVDNTPPTVVCPPTQTLELASDCSAAIPDYRSLATTYDACGIAGVVQVAPPGFVVSGVGSITAALVVTDVNNNVSQCNFTINKVDNTPPTIACPPTQTLVLGSACSAALPNYTSLATANDNCGVQSVMQSPAAGTLVSGAGNMSVTLTVTDINGNTNTCTFTVTKVDNTAPTIACPPTQTLVLGSTCSATLPDYRSLATANDNCGVQSVTQSPAAGTTVSNAGNMTVTLTVTDINGNSNTCTFTVTKVDNTAPTVQCFNQTITFNGQTNIALNTDDLVDASDNCGVASISLSPDHITCEQLGQTVPVTITVTDVNNNVSTCTSYITVTGLPCGWSQNPNGVGCAGGSSNTYNPNTGVWTATSTNCFYGPPYTSDATSFAQRTLCGDGSITAHVTSINGNGWAGVVMRESNAPVAKKAQLMTNLSQFHRREFRTTTNGAAQPQQIGSNNRHWLRIVRAGNQFTMYASANGINWFPVGAQNIAMSNCIQMGLVASNFTANSTV
ncbi:MAG TPA: HYR domain-containing protein, partial [Saprospiraceae bacterium]|nr:HYR domain-containing protein [Saprospiraceae bacterium]